MECREIESLARGLEGLNGEPAHPKSRSATPALIGLSRKDVDQLGPCSLGLGVGGSDALAAALSPHGTLLQGLSSYCSLNMRAI